MEVDHDFEQVTDLNGSTLRVGGLMIPISVEQCLVDGREIAGAAFNGDELKEAARAVEDLADTGRRQSAGMPWNVDVEACVKKLPQRVFDARVTDTVETRSDVADPGVLSEHGGRQIPRPILGAGERRECRGSEQHARFLPLLHGPGYGALFHRTGRVGL